jgi:hypothetical protein
MRSMQCNVEFGYQLSIRSGTKENHGKISLSLVLRRTTYVLLSGLPRKPLVTIPVLLRLLVTAVILFTDLGNRYFVSDLGNLWEVHMEGSHSGNKSL